MTLAENQKRIYQSNIQVNNNKIQHYEELYDSLLRFRSTVSESQEQFSFVNSKKKSMISGLGEYSSECKIVNEYSNGMNKVLNGIGESYVNCTFYALLSSIDFKLAEYKGKIQALEVSNRLFGTQISLLDEKIRKEIAEARERDW